MKKLVKILIALVVLLVIGYFIVMNLPKANIKNKEAIKSVSASALFQEFEKNENLASKNYIGKVITVAGTIKKKMLDNQEAPVVLLGTNSEDQVLVTLAVDQAKKLENFKVGDEINVKAQCSGMLMEVVMNKGIIAE